MRIVDVVNAGGICHGVYNSELSLPVRGIEKLPQIESVVIRRVCLCVIGRSYCAHLMSIDGIVVEETLDLGSNFMRREMAPRDAEFAIHADWSTTGYLSKSAVQT